MILLSVLASTSVPFQHLLLLHGRSSVVLKVRVGTPMRYLLAVVEHVALWLVAGHVTQRLVRVGLDEVGAFV